MPDERPRSRRTSRTARAQGTRPLGPVVVAQEAIDSVREAHAEAVDTYLDKELPYPNLVGVGIGHADAANPNSEKAAVWFFLAAEDETNGLPKRIRSAPCMSIVTGRPIAGALNPLARRIRPVVAGFSVGHVNVTAGTIADAVYELLPGANVNPPMQGIGIPPRYFILSNNHVLANINRGVPGDPVLQPGPLDGGTVANDQVAVLTRFVPLDLFPPLPLPQHRNVVDAAIAEVLDSQDVDRMVHWIGRIDGWRIFGLPGQLVRKTGRTTNYSQGRIQFVNAVIDVNYPTGQVGRFRDQIITTLMSAPGDSGSAVITLDLPRSGTFMLGLLFAASPTISVMNRVDHVRSSLRVEVGEQLG